MKLGLTFVELNLSYGTQKYSLISYHKKWDGTGCWNPFSLKTRFSLLSIVTSIVIDVLATQAAMAWVAMVLFQLYQKIPVQNQKG